MVQYDDKTYCISGGRGYRRKRQLMQVLLKAKMHCCSYFKPECCFDIVKFLSINSSIIIIVNLENRLTSYKEYSDEDNFQRE